MSQTDSERLIERFLAGEMSPDEERRFFNQAATDDRLRLELKAQQAIETSIRRERDAISRRQATARARFAATLANSHAAMPSPPGTAKTTGESRGGAAGWAIAVAIAVAAGAFWFAGESDPPPSGTSAPRADTAVQAIIPQPAPPVQAQREPIDRKSPPESTARRTTRPAGNNAPAVQSNHLPRVEPTEEVAKLPDSTKPPQMKASIDSINRR